MLLLRHMSSWHLLSSLPMRCPPVFYTVLLPSWSISSLCHCQGLCHFQGRSLPRTQHLSLLNFIMFFLIGSCSLPRFLWMAGLSSSVSPSSPQFGVIHQMDKSVHHPLPHVTDKDIKQDRSQDRLLPYPSCYQSKIL